MPRKLAMARASYKDIKLKSDNPNIGYIGIFNMQITRTN